MDQEIKLQSQGLGFTFSPNDSAETLIVLFGFTGAKLKVLAKFRDALNEIGCSTLFGVLKTKHIVRVKAPEAIPKTILDDVSCILESEQRLKRVVFMVLSGGGGIVYRSILELFKTGQYDLVQEKTTGVIFDSFPGKLNVENTLKALSNGKPRPILATLLSPLDPYVKRKTDGLYDALKYANFKTDKLKELYLCSKADAIITYGGGISELKEAIDYRSSQLGVSVTIQVWDDSPHIMHLKHDPEKYKQTIKAWLSEMDI